MKVFVVAGTAMNSGKTFTAASIVHGLKSKGYRVAGIKGTGTGSGGDLWQMKDMGADLVLDFTDAGFASTYKLPDASIEDGVFRLLDHAASQHCDYAILEIADGLQHAETAALLSSPALRARASGCIFAAYDSLGAMAGSARIVELGYSLVAISGQLTRSPLAMREAQACGYPLFTPFDIQAGALVPLLEGCNAAQPEVTAELPAGMLYERSQVVTMDETGQPEGEARLNRLRHNVVGVSHALDFPDDDWENRA